MSSILGAGNPQRTGVTQPTYGTSGTAPAATGASQGQNMGATSAQSTPYDPLASVRRCMQGCASLLSDPQNPPRVRSLGNPTTSASAQSTAQPAMIISMDGSKGKEAESDPNLNMRGQLPPGTVLSKEKFGERLNTLTQGKESSVEGAEKKYETIPVPIETSDGKIAYELWKSDGKGGYQLQRELADTPPPSTPPQATPSSATPAPADAAPPPPPPPAPAPTDAAPPPPAPSASTLPPPPPDPE